MLISHGGALLVLQPLGLPWWAVVVGAAALMGSFTTLFAQHILTRGKNGIAEVIAEADGGWLLRNAAGLEWRGTLLTNSYIHSHVLILNFQLALANDRKRRRTVILLSDSSDPNSLRRLRVRLQRFRPDDDKKFQ